ncbi:hypothetical protein GGTG_14243 [Gaeumannomyces tritici R3-111a-1]|uniref:Uncharacterized protein n=1 Tax=Gaeumannomyces tritici (strain R3-111a-1) TaxID=644352 RepID=J3PL09_GAET3|nr:hypothetical protein GGTG_14243 [Gaeumannomyces tritici R3-111a-1]EJT68178.1 hypothetical protein GGTG_14243 [Gaeumannomyces tritici R3-111a-1]
MQRQYCGRIVDECSANASRKGPPWRVHGLALLAAHRTADLCSSCLAKPACFQPKTWHPITHLPPRMLQTENEAATHAARAAVMSRNHRQRVFGHVYDASGRARANILGPEKAVPEVSLREGVSERTLFPFVRITQCCAAPSLSRLRAHQVVSLAGRQSATQRWLGGSTCSTEPFAGWEAAFSSPFRASALRSLHALTG